MKTINITEEKYNELLKKSQELDELKKEIMIKANDYLKPHYKEILKRKEKYDLYFSKYTCMYDCISCDYSTRVSLLQHKFTFM